MKLYFIVYLAGSNWFVIIMKHVYSNHTISSLLDPDNSIV